MSRWFSSTRLQLIDTASRIYRRYKPVLPLAAITASNYYRFATTYPASKIDPYLQLRATAATFGDGSIEQLVPHVTSLLKKLNDISKHNSGWKQEAGSLRSSLLASEKRFLDLNVSFKDKSVACGQLEDRYDAGISNLNNLLAKCREENEALKERL
ncbi:hypothetical protein J6590_069055 [Homalodisca vitripennis]|nr:hypothetical protein J6590_069055 [Homalodisca vitripennis]